MEETGTMTMTTMTESAPAAVPVHVIGGYLGSGKTTLLDRLLTWELARGGRPGVVVNEFGERDVDGGTVHAAHGAERVDVVGLVGGCVCCDRPDDLGQAVGGLLSDAGRTAVYVETTGLASLPAVVQALEAALPTLAGRARLGHIIGVLDATRVAALPDVWEPAGGHLRTADAVLVNHADRAAEGVTARARLAATKMAPGARVWVTSFAEVDPATLLGAPVARPRRRRAVTPADTTRGYSTAGFELCGPIDLTALGALVRRFPKTLARLKGVVRVTDDERPREVQYSPGNLQVRVSTAPPAAPYLVAIGRRIVWDRFLDGIDACVVRPPRRRRARP
jgi:G3E family GTPase